MQNILQINERNTDEFSIWYKYDMEYIDNWSLLLDIKIILKTPISLFSRTDKVQVAIQNSDGKMSTFTKN